MSNLPLGSTSTPSEYTKPQAFAKLILCRYGFRKLIENRAVDILQPDVMWLGGLTELIKVARWARRCHHWNCG